AAARRAGAFQSERLLVELRGLLSVRNDDGDVTNSGHGGPSLFCGAPKNLAAFGLAAIRFLMSLEHFPMSLTRILVSSPVCADCGHCIAGSSRARRGRGQPDRKMLSVGRRSQSKGIEATTNASIRRRRRFSPRRNGGVRCTGILAKRNTPKKARKFRH